MRLRDVRIPAHMFPKRFQQPVLKRTLGVPLFQEQLLRMAMTVASFTGAEAEELHRAVGMRRSMQRMKDLEGRLRAGMMRNGIGPEAQNNIAQGISSFAMYGFGTSRPMPSAWHCRSADPQAPPNKKRTAQVFLH